MTISLEFRIPLNLDHTSLSVFDELTTPAQLRAAPFTFHLAYRLQPGKVRLGMHEQQDIIDPTI